LEMSRALADDRRLRVLGIVMIDSVYPLPPPGGWAGLQLRAPVVARHIEWSANTKQETRVAVERCFLEAAKMAREWVLPVWDAEQEGREQEEGGRPAGRRRPPPAVLLRSREKVPAPDGILGVDIYRGERTVGWDNYREGIFCRIIDIPGHHFNVFALEYLSEISAGIRSACQTIEEVIFSGIDEGFVADMSK